MAGDRLMASAVVDPANECGDDPSKYCNREQEKCEASGDAREADLDCDDANIAEDERTNISAHEWCSGLAARPRYG